MLPGGFDDIADGAFHGGTGSVVQLAGDAGVELLGEGLRCVPGVFRDGKAQAAVADVLRGNPQGFQKLPCGVRPGATFDRYNHIFYLSLQELPSIRIARRGWGVQG